MRFSDRGDGDPVSRRPKLPNVMGDVAKGVKNFKAGLNEPPDSDEDGKDGKVLTSDETPTTGDAAVSEAGLKRDEAAKG